MKKALFSLQTVINPWKPPFHKKIETEEVEVHEGQEFDSIEKEPQKIFKLIKCNAEHCTVEYSGKFTLKGHEHPGNRQVEVGKEAISFTYLWGEEGITKKLTLKEIEEA